MSRPKRLGFLRKRFRKSLTKLAYFLRQLSANLHARGVGCQWSIGLHVLAFPGQLCR